MCIFDSVSLATYNTSQMNNDVELDGLSIDVKH